MYYLFYGMPDAELHGLWTVRCRGCVVKNCSSTEYLYCSSTEYLRSSAKLARPRRWLEDLTCHQRTLQRRVEPRGGRSGGRRRGRFRSGQRAIDGQGVERELLSRGRRAKCGETERVRCTIAPLNNKTLHPRTH